MSIIDRMGIRHVAVEWTTVTAPYGNAQASAIAAQLDEKIVDLLTRVAA